MRTFLLIAALCLAACSTEQEASMRDNPGEGWTSVDTDNVASFEAEDMTLGKKIDIGDLRSYTDGKGGLKVTCQIRNVTDHNILIQLHAIFQKEDRTSVFQTPWQSFVLPVGKFIPFEATNGEGATRVVIALRVPLS